LLSWVGWPARPPQSHGVHHLGAGLRQRCPGLRRSRKMIKSANFRHCRLRQTGRWCRRGCFLLRGCLHRPEPCEGGDVNNDQPGTEPVHTCGVVAISAFCRALRRSPSRRWRGDKVQLRLRIVTIFRGEPKSITAVQSGVA
jgi:hypothetical protein